MKKIFGLSPLQIKNLTPINELQMQIIGFNVDKH